MIYQHEYPIRLRRDLEGRAVSLMEMADWLKWKADQSDHGDSEKLREIADYILDSAGVVHSLATEKAQAGALLQGHVLGLSQEGGAA